MLGAAVPFRRALSVVLLTGLFAAAYPAVRAGATEAVTDLGDLVPPKGVLFGTSLVEEGTPDPAADPAGFESAMNRTMDLNHHYYSWEEPFPTATEQQDLSSGRLPVISWGGTTLSQIIDGSYDDLIRSRARAVGDLGLPVFLSWGYEMNGTGHPWSGPDNNDAGHVNGPWKFVTAWHRVHDLFVEEGAGNVVWVWQPKAQSDPSAPWNDVRLYYPGDNYVDWIGISGYNEGVASDSGWRSFSKIFEDAYGTFSGRKPIMVQTGSANLGGDRSAWIRNAAETIQKRFTGVRAFVYSNHPRWDLRDDPQDLATLATMGGALHFRPLSPPQGGVVPGGWVNALASGASGDGVTDDTEALRSALGSGGSKVLVPPGTYLISDTLTVSSGTTVWFAPGARLLGAVRDYQGACLLDMYSVRDVALIGGVVDGQKEMNPTGYLYGVCLDGDENLNVRIGSMTVANMPARDAQGGNGGDGLYLRSGTDVLFDGIVADGNVRQGLSMTGELHHVVVTDSVFSGTTGSYPGAGLDIEPNPNGYATRDVVIRDSKFVGNNWGLIVTRSSDPTGSIDDVRIKNNVIQDNRSEGLYLMGETDSPMTGIRVVGNRVDNNGRAGIVAYNRIRGSIVDNLVRSNAGDGVLVEDDRDPMVLRKNLIVANEHVGVRVRTSKFFRVVRNEVTMNGLRGILARQRKSPRKIGVVRRNKVWNNQMGDGPSMA